MQQFIARTKEPMFLTGVLLILLSFGFFCLPLCFEMTSDRVNGLFVANFAIAAGYFIAVRVWKRGAEGRDKLIPMILFFILLLISAYSLNRDMNIFDESVPWFTVLLILLCANYILSQYFSLLPGWAQHLMAALLGVGIVTFGYLAIYLTPLYIIGLVAFFVLGISLHVFVPLWLVIFSMKLTLRLGRHHKRLWYSFAGGAACCILFVVAFSIQWASTSHRLAKVYRRAGIANHDGLPPAVAVAQQASSGWITERILKSGLVYSSPNQSGNWERIFWGSPFRGNWEEPLKHDPLVMIAAFFTPPPAFNQEDRINILEANFDARHQAQERLWSGHDLLTEHVVTNVRIWPAFGVSYTEKTVIVTNTAQQNTWGGGQQEAIYTFHLPEGSVITSLSLWIEGKEEKGILTSRSRADSAYKTVVGRERRDPSLVHWQEGNAVSVRVFPVIPGQSRQFKLGITSPLVKQQQKLVYENVWFEGPDAQKATEDATLEFQQTPAGLDAPAVFASHGQQSLKRSGRYDPTWKISLHEQPLCTGSFCFDGRSYSVHPYQQQRSAFDPRDIYLDIDQSWTKAEFEFIYDQLKHKNIYVSYEGLVQVTADNRQHLFGALQDYQYSMFPLFEIKDPANSLLITKSHGISPNINDLGDSRYKQQLTTYLTSQGKIRLFNFGNELSPYLKSLKEYRVFDYEHGTLDDLKKLIDNKQFARSIENDEQVVIDDAGLVIREQACASVTTAPDHLMRLFTYNHLMQQVGKGFLSKASIEDTLVQEAAKAYVVSPVSSLVVLETKKDYERFDIKDTDNSLKNASLNGKGAVPEPHEWALIIIAVFVILTIKYKPQLLKRRA